MNILMDTSYCSSKANDNNLPLLEDRNAINIPFANFNLLVNNDKTVEALLTFHNLESLLKTYANYFETLMLLDTFVSKINKVKNKNSAEVNKNLLFAGNFRELKENNIKIMDKQLSFFE